MANKRAATRTFIGTSVRMRLLIRVLLLFLLSCPIGRTVMRKFLVCLMTKTKSYFRSRVSSISVSRTTSLLCMKTWNNVDAVDVCFRWLVLILLSLKKHHVCKTRTLFLKLMLKWGSGKRLYFPSGSGTGEGL